MSLIGRSVKRLEDRPLLTGSGRFAADVTAPDMLYMRVVRSPVAFGRLTGVRIAEARAHPGTVAVWTAKDVADIPPIGFRLTPVPGLEPYRQPVLASGHVRYVGEPIAAVFAAGELTAEATFTTDHMTYPYGVHLAQVRIQRDSCAIAVERFFVGYDVGRAVNPMLVEGQIAGGAAQGIGAALLEEFVYDASGQPQSVTLAEYLMPTIAEIPTIEVSLFEDAPTPLNPLGVKGAGEAGIAAAGAAIAAAVDDALGRVGAVRQLPITPNRLHTLLAELPAAER
jgi:CO/xanthine dehydrogenase Mo-binding subunit